VPDMVDEEESDEILEPELQKLVDNHCNQKIYNSLFDQNETAWRAKVHYPLLRYAAMGGDETNQTLLLGSSMTFPIPKEGIPRSSESSPDGCYLKRVKKGKIDVGALKKNLGSNGSHLITDNQFVDIVIEMKPNITGKNYISLWKAEWETHLYGVLALKWKTLFFPTEECVVYGICFRDVKASIFEYRTTPETFQPQLSLIWSNDFSSIASLQSLIDAIRALVA